MATSRFLRLLHRSGWEFWLPLPLIAALFWFAGNITASQVLRRPYGSISKLHVNSQSDVEWPMEILAITATIDRNRDVTTVLIRMTDVNSKPLTYEYPVTKASQVEVAIAQALKLPVEDIRKIISYRIRD